MLQVSLREVYVFLHKTDDFSVRKFGRLIRIESSSYDEWFNGCEYRGCQKETYTAEQIAHIMRISPRSALRLMQNASVEFRVLHICSVTRAHKISFDHWIQDNK